MRSSWPAAAAVLAIAWSGASAAHAAPTWEEPVEFASGRVDHRLVVAASKAGAAVAWVEPRGEGCVIQDQVGCERVRVAVRPRGGDFLPPATVSPDGTGAFLNDLAVTSSGDVLASWMRDDPDSEHNALEVAVGSVASGAFGRVRKLRTNGALPFAVFATNGRGEAALSWPEWPSGRTAGMIRGTVRSRAGRFSRPATLAEVGDQVPHAPALGDDGRLLVLWTTPAAGGDRDLYARVRARDGSLGKPQLVHTVEATNGNASVAALEAAWTRAGGRVATWAGVPHDCFYCTRETVFAAWAPPDRRFGAPQQLSASDESNDEPRLAVAPSGRTIVAWARADGTETFPENYDRRFSQAEEGTRAVPFEIRFATRAHGRDFGRTRSIGKDAAQARVVMSRGDAFLAWAERSGGGTPDTAVGAFRPADLRERLFQRFPSARRVFGLEVASGPRGDLILAWTEGERENEHPPWRVMVAVGRR